MATRVLLEHVRHVCPPELKIELLVLVPEEIVALADVEGEEGGVVLELNGVLSNPRVAVELSSLGALHESLRRKAWTDPRAPRPAPRRSRTGASDNRKGARRGGASNASVRDLRGGERVGRRAAALDVGEGDSGRIRAGSRVVFRAGPARLLSDQRDEALRAAARLTLQLPEERPPSARRSSRQIKLPLDHEAERDAQEDN
jgi:hypothetical protein